MTAMDILVIGAVVLAVLLLIGWTIRKNRKDKKDMKRTLYHRDFPPAKDSDDDADRH